MSNASLSDDQQRFIDDFAALLLPWGMSITAGRLYAYLLLAAAPVSLDEFAEALGISKSNASSAARVLEVPGIARRITDRGSKRIYYEVTADPGIALRRNADTLNQMARLIESRKEAVSTGASLVRLTELGQFHSALREAMIAVIEGPQKGLPHK